MIRLELCDFEKNSTVMKCPFCCILSVQFSRWVVSDSLWLQVLQHERTHLASLRVPWRRRECGPSLVKVVSTRSHYCTFALLLFCLLEVSHSLAPSERGRQVGIKLYLLAPWDLTWPLHSPITCLGRTPPRFNCSSQIGGGCCSATKSHWTASPWTAACKASLPITVSWTWLRFMYIELVVLSNHFILCRPLLLLPSSFSSIWVFPSESALHIRWPKAWSFSFSPSNEYSELISFRIDWFDLLSVQGTLKSLLQHHNLKASILQHVQPSLRSDSHICTWLLEKP